MKITAIGIAAALALGASAASAAAVPVPELVAHTADWVNARGFDVGAPGARVASVAEGTAEYQANGWPLPIPVARSGRDGIVFYAPFAPKVESLARRYGRRGAVTWGQVAAARVVLHEVLHQEGVRDELGYYADLERERVVAGQSMSFWEEAATEALTLDWLPDYLRELYGARVSRANVDLAGSLTYWPRARAVRQMSVYATGAPHWRTVEAYTWRADLLRADYPTRAAMIADAHTMKENQ